MSGPPFETPIEPFEAEARQIEGLSVERRDGILVLRLHRPGGNRFSYALLEGLGKLFQDLREAPAIRVVLLCGEGDDFSFGADLTDARLASAVSGGREERTALARLGQGAVDAWARLPIPTIAAGRGRIIGAGACFFATADFQFASSEATMQFPEVDRGMHLSWGIVPRLVAVYGKPWATELSLTGKAVSCGDLPRPPLHVENDPLEAALRHAEMLAAKPPLAVRAIKRVLIDSSELLEHGADDDAALFADTVGSEDFAEAMAAWFAKRPGDYKGR